MRGIPQTLKRNRKKYVSLGLYRGHECQFRGLLCPCFLFAIALEKHFALHSTCMRKCCPSLTYFMLPHLYYGLLIHVEQPSFAQQPPVDNSYLCDYLSTQISCYSLSDQGCSPLSCLGLSRPFYAPALTLFLVLKNKQTVCLLSISCSTKKISLPD